VVAAVGQIGRSVEPSVVAVGSCHGNRRSERARVRVVAAGLVGLALLGCGAGAAGSHALSVGAVRGRIVGPSAWQLEQAQPIAVSFVSKQRGFLATDGGHLLATGDGGRSWHRVGPRLRFLKLDFLSARGRYALTKSGVLLETVDGGRAWSRLHAFGISAGSGLFAGGLEFVDRGRGARRS
jgi:photosynthesis system II assembly factor YCF48-like protein